MKAKLYVNFFILYYIFAIIGSNLYLGLTALSFGNIGFASLFILMIFDKGFFNLEEVQKSFILPFIFFIILVTLYLVGYLDVADSNIISKYFYLVTIPLLMLMIFSIGNKYGEYFFKKTYFIIKVILLLLVVVIAVELLFNIHAPTYETKERMFNIPAAFFGNSNDVGAMVVAIYLLFIPFNQRYGNRKGFFLYTFAVVFMVVASFSRLAFVVLLLLFPFYFVVVRQKSVRFVLITFLAAVSLIYVLSNIVINYIPNKEIDQLGWINNRLLSITDKNIYDAEGSSSFGIRYSIYGYPFKNPQDFIIGYGINGDQTILKKEIRWSGITNAHSFFMETVYDFGWLGLLLALWFFIVITWYAFNNRKDMQFRYALLFIGSFVVLINISSSVFGKPIIWAPLFIYLAFISSKAFNKNSVEILNKA